MVTIEDFNALKDRVGRLEAKTSSGDSSFFNSIPFLGKSAPVAPVATGSNVFDRINPLKTNTTDATSSTAPSVIDRFKSFTGTGGKRSKRKRSTRSRSRRR